MATDKKLKGARDAFLTLCKTLDDLEWNYEKNEDEFSVNFSVKGDDFPMDFTIKCDVERQFLRLFSFLPFKISKEKRVEGALVTCMANYRMADGSFDYDSEDGTILFRMTAGYRDSIISTELCEYFIHCACSTVDHYNDKFFMVSKGMMSVEEVFQD